MKRAIIFDFDGTIADSLPAMIQVFEELTGRTEPLSVEQIATYRHLSLIELTYELGIPKWKIPVLVVRGRHMLHKHILEIKLHKGIAAAIKQLHANGERLYILSSNSSENVNRYLAHHELDQYFIGVYGGASVLGKAPRLNKLITHEKVDVTKSWYVGDETRDVIAAHSVGLQVVSVSWGFNSRESLSLKRPELLVDTTKELVEGLRNA